MWRHFSGWQVSAEPAYNAMVQHMLDLEIDNASLTQQVAQLRAEVNNLAEQQGNAWQVSGGPASARPGHAGGASPVLRQPQMALQQQAHWTTNQMQQPAVVELPDCISHGIHADFGVVSTGAAMTGDEVSTSLAIGSWISHLRCTLYAENEGGLNQVELHMYRTGVGNFQITKCFTPANRFFYVRCKSCNRFVYGCYGKHEQPHQFAKARSDLEAFCGIEKNSNVEEV